MFHLFLRAFSNLDKEMFCPSRKDTCLYGLLVFVTVIGDVINLLPSFLNPAILQNGSEIDEKSTRTLREEEVRQADEKCF